MKNLSNTLKENVHLITGSGLFATVAGLFLRENSSWITTGIAFCALFIAALLLGVLYEQLDKAHLTSVEGIVIEFLLAILSILLLYFVVNYFVALIPLLDFATALLFIIISFLILARLVYKVIRIFT